MPRTTKPPVDPDDAPLKRLGGGRWQTRDERFTIEPQSGTWVIVDAEQTDDFGLPLVRGPFASLTAAKEAIAGARASAPAASPLAERIERRRTQGPPDEPTSPAPRTPRTARAGKREVAGGAADEGRRRAGSRAAAPDRRSAAKRREPDEAPREPGWLTDLAAEDRGRARRLIARLAEDGVSDAEGLVRRDVVGGVPALAAHAIAGRLAQLDADAPIADVAELLADGRDDRLGVRWRLVDGEGRPIVLEARAGRR